LHDPTFSAVARVAFSRDDLSATEKLVLIAMGSFFNANSREAYPSASTLATMTGLHAKSVRRAWRILERSKIIRNHGQRMRREDDGTKVLSSNLFSLLVDLDTPSAHGQGVHLTPKTSTTSNVKGTSVDTESTEYASDLKKSESQLWVQELATVLSYCLADTLIDQKLKKPWYRDDAASPEWLGEMTHLILSTLPQVRHRVDAPESKTVVQAIYEEAVRMSPNRVDYRVCHPGYVPPRLLRTRIDELLGHAARVVAPPPSGETVQTPSLEELEQRRERKQELEAIARDIMEKQSRRT
jgi:hypothetical protein